MKYVIEVTHLESSYRREENGIVLCTHLSPAALTYIIIVVICILSR
jgi:hypothetical protein